MLFRSEMRLLLSQTLEGQLDADAAQGELERLAKDYQARVDWWQAHPPFGLERDLLGEQHQAAGAFIRASRDMLATLAEGDLERARQQLAGAHALYLKHRAAVDVTVVQGNALADRSMAQFDATGQRGVQIQLALMGLSVLGLGLLSWRTARALVKPLDQAVDLAESVTAGDLSRRAHVQGQDEPAKLLHALDRMCRQLGEMVAEMRQGSLRMASACAQIHAGNLDLKSRTQGHLGELGHVSSNQIGRAHV